MKLAYFDCFSGASGDMILGALLDAGLDLKKLEAELKKLKLSGYKLRAEKEKRGEISGTKFSVDVNAPSSPCGGPAINTAGRQERNLKDVVKIIDGSDLSKGVKDLSKKIFEELATIEAKIHKKDVEEIHFHEVGGLDSIVDVVGSLIGLEKLGVETVYSSKIHVGTGFVECRHGVLPVPAPATLELLKGVPIYSKGIEAELTTPTGAAILKSVTKSFGKMPQMKVEKVGYGVGSRELEIPNLLRIYVGESKEGEYEEDEVVLIETNIDDMNPEFFDYASERLFDKGALDVFTTSIFMKKGRPGIMLSILAAPERLDDVLATLFAETTTFGVRIHHLQRQKLAREVIAVKTEFGKVKVKVGKVGEEVKNIAPEYEDCKKIALEKNISLKDVYDAAKRAASLGVREEY